MIVVGVLVALAVDAAREARGDRGREATYLLQLRADLDATADNLTNAISVEEQARENADRAIAALGTSRLSPSDSLAAWTLAATNSSASFHPTMGTVTALVESGELRLLRDNRLRQSVLQYHSAVASTLRIIDGVGPHTWRTIERLGGMLSWTALLDRGQDQRFPIDWERLASERSFHSALYDLRLVANNRLFALRTLRENLELLRVELERSLE